MSTRPYPNEEKSILPKTYDPETGTINFMTGPIAGNPHYAMRKDGSVVRTGARILNKKERRRNKIAQAAHATGFNFLCSCKAMTFHFLSKTKVPVEGYEELQQIETVECAICGAHFDKEKIDAALAAHADRERRMSEPQIVP